MSFIEGSARTVESAGQSARVYDAGEGRPVVVLHGWGGRIESMAPLLKCLTHTRVIAIDLPGFGRSPAPTEPWGTPQYADFVEGLLAGLGVERADFIGHSFGGKVSVYLAATRPGLVDKLVLAGSSGLRKPPSFKTRIKRMISKQARRVGALGAPGRRIRDALYRKIASDDYKQAGELRAILVKVVNEDLTDMLPQVRSSTLLIWGSEDDAVPLSHARTFEELIPDAGLVVMEGAGHFAYLDESDRFCAIVRNFFGLGA